MILTEEQFVNYLVDHDYPITGDTYCLVIRSLLGWDEYFAGAAEQMGYSQFDITYNMVTFNSAADVTGRATLFLNPYVELDWDELAVPEFKKPIWAVLKDLEDRGADVMPPTQADADMWAKLPNGWDSDYAFRLLKLVKPEQMYVRPAPGLALPEYMLKRGYTILHPWKSRPLNQFEIDSIMQSNFIDVMLEKIEKSTIYESPDLCCNDINWQPKVPVGYEVRIENPYKWKPNA
jgi:hypothetical protein